MHILCIDDDPIFCQMLKNEAKAIGIQISVVSPEQIDEKVRDLKPAACVLNASYRTKISEGGIKTSLIYKTLPIVSDLKESKRSGVEYVGGQSMSADEAHYLLAKLCRLANRLEPECDWVAEIPESLMQDYLNLALERLAHIENLIHDLKKQATDVLWEELKNVVHKIAGSAGLYGRSKASEICKEVEIKLKNKEYSTIDLDNFYRQLYLYIQ